MRDAVERGGQGIGAHVEDRALGGDALVVGQERLPAGAIVLLAR